MMYIEGGKGRGGKRGRGMDGKRDRKRRERGYR